MCRYGRDRIEKVISCLFVVEKIAKIVRNDKSCLFLYESRISDCSLLVNVEKYNIE